MTIGERIKAKRKEKNISVEYVAKALGVSVSTVYRYEDSTIEKIPIKVFDKLCQIFETSASELMGNDSTVQKTADSELPREFENAQDAMEFMLKMPTLAAFGGYNPDEMSEETIVEFANEMRAQQIIRLACDIKSVWKTNNPFEIAEKYGIKVLIRNVNIGDFKAQTLKMEGYPTIISINGLYSTLSQKVLCAHELGHALLHTEPINHFDVTTKNVHTNVEYEANLFAVALLCNEDEFNMPLAKMSNAVLKSILDCNVSYGQGEK